MVDAKFTTNVEGVLRRLICQFIMHPQHLKISHAHLGTSLTFYMQASKGDTGKIIGSKGKHFDALNNILLIVGFRNGVNVKLARLKDPVSGAAERFPDTAPQSQWPRKEVMERLKEIASLIFQEQVCVASQDVDEENTAIELQVSKTEPANIIRGVKMPLETIFEAIGNVHGRKISLTISPTLEPQPQSARGRYAGVR